MKNIIQQFPPILKTDENGDTHQLLPAQLIVGIGEAGIRGEISYVAIPVHSITETGIKYRTGEPARVSAIPVTVADFGEELAIAIGTKLHELTAANAAQYFPHLAPQAPE